MSHAMIHRPRRRLSRRTVEFTLSFLVLCFMLINVHGAYAGVERQVDDVLGSGALILREQDGGERPALRLGTDMRVSIAGRLARVTVVQAFRNDGEDWAEASYLYPLPEDGAVDGLKMVVGDRVVIGEIQRRDEARRLYNQAKSEGRKAGLVEQRRPNVFSSRVANLAPGETVLVEIEYQAQAALREGRYELRLPLVVAPRYASRATLAAPEGAASVGAVAAPVLDPADRAPINPVSISVSLDAGFPVKDIESLYHLVDVKPGVDGTRIITLAEGEVPADRDFVLHWASAAAAPTLTLFRERFEGRDYLMAEIAPPTPASDRPTPPRELILVIDNSGSMAGPSMEQAKRSLIYALDDLTTEDRFNLIRFDDTMTELFQKPVAAGAEAVARAKTYVASLEANGGTEMLPALETALVDDTPEDAERVRQVLFLTDGAISDERSMLEALGAGRGRSRVFMVGIGSAPNGFLMNRMAEMGRGRFIYIGDVEEVAPRMKTLLERLTRPVATRLMVEMEGGDARFAPERLPDLYAGEPLTLLAQTTRLGGSLTLSGMVDGAPWRRTLALSGATEAEGVARFWARRAVADVEVATRLGETERAKADEAIALLGLKFHLVTRETSLVAVDRTPSRPAGAQLTEAELPINLPKGWDFAKVFGPRPAAAAQRPRTGTLAEDPVEPLPLPATATAAELAMLVGAALLAAGLLGLRLTRRRDEPCA